MRKPFPFIRRRLFFVFLHTRSRLDRLRKNFSFYFLKISKYEIFLFCKCKCQSEIYSIYAYFILILTIAALFLYIYLSFPVEVMHLFLPYDDHVSRKQNLKRQK